MDKFGDAYREALQELPQVSISVEEVRDEVHHYKMQRQRRKILIAKGCAAAAVFILCSVGTVAAKNYRESIISVSENGFTITNTDETQNLSRRANELGGILDMTGFLKIGGVFSTVDAVPDIEEIECFEPEIREYDSVDAFLAEEDVVIAVPSRALLAKEFTSERVCVIGDGQDVHMDFMNETAYFSVHQMDNREYENYSSATSYMGRSCNERSYTNRQGLSYVMFDTVDEKGALQSVHAVISVNGRDLTVSFGGFEENEIERVLSNLDLSVYY